MLMFLIPAVLAEQGEALDIFFKLFSLGWCHLLNYVEKLLPDELCPVESLFMVVVL